jgi:hypothetical protein
MRVFVGEVLTSDAKIGACRYPRSLVWWFSGKGTIKERCSRLPRRAFFSL